MAQYVRVPQVPTSRRLVVGLDFGTYASGIAYRQLSVSTTFGASQAAVRQVFDWPDQSSAYPKTRTALLYHLRRPIAWGWTAEKEYSTLSAAGHDLHDYTYITNFKLALDPASGYALPAGFHIVDVITDYLRFMKDFTVAQLRGSYPGSTIHADLIQWCLTVPAMWADSQKNDMREAAHHAGLISQRSSDQLLVILEPEAAAMYAHLSNAVVMSPGQQFMVVDAGGGTVDLTSHTVVVRNGEPVLSEAATGRGGFCGSTYVDRQFEGWFRTQIGEGVFDAWKLLHPDEYVQLLGQWELEKRAFPRADIARIEIRLPAELMSQMSPSLVRVLEELNDGYDDRLLLSAAQMVAFFDPVIENVVQLEREQAAAAGTHGGKVLLVGGFAGSPYYASKMRVQVTAGTRVVVPPHAASAVLLGAVEYGCNPDLIHTRCCRLAYGVEMDRPARSSDPSVHQYWHCEERCMYAKEVFDKFVSRDQRVEVNQVVEHTYYPVYHDLPAMDIRLYATDVNGCSFVTDTGTHQLASLIVDLPSGYDRHTYRVNVKLMFGRTELTVTATDAQTGVELNSTIRFAHARVPLR